MLDTATKRRIDTARDILVGKVPDPKSQVEQITIALIYKFMWDIDAESEELGGERSFFVGEFDRYGWPRLMHAGLGGHATLNLYAEALDRIPENPGVPPLFRGIFNNAYLPYRDPETLRAFLKVIDEFEYDHSERLGDAFEYLLSVMGAQGDAGQFRTPRHIIDFIVAVIDPKKHETVLDPACGTAGFLISSYKHILAANRDEHGQSTLTPDDRGRLADNFMGYDISPDMVRLSLVNMYLHGFADPRIDEYDTLTNDERWSQHADVILANPPFMSPKGGIRPHNRFSVQAKRSEVLFVDYMAEHLTPTGRAGIIVPEGIIFQSQKAHTQLRKMLVEDYLVAVISLPAGVFKPYSGVKTSILILDRDLARRSDRIAFFKVENDGFDLGAQRRPIDQNDLPQVQAELTDYLRRTAAGESVDELEPALGLVVAKARIAADAEYNLSGDRYRINSVRSSRSPIVRLGEVAEIIAGQSPPGRSYNDAAVGAPFYQGKSEFREIFIGEPVKWTTDPRRFADVGDILMSVRAPVGPVNLTKQRICIGRGLAGIRPDSEHLLTLYAFHILRSLECEITGNSGAAFASISKRDMSNIEVPLPPLDVQQEIVAEIESYQKVIDGARAVIDNYRPHIPIDTDWPVVGITDLVSDNPHSFKAGPFGSALKKDSYVPTGYKIYGQEQVIRGDSGFGDYYISSEKYDELQNYRVKARDVLVSLVGSYGKTLVVPHDFEPGIINPRLAKISLNPKRMIPEFFVSLFVQEIVLEQIEALSHGGTMNILSIKTLKRLRLPMPPVDDQRTIVDQIEREEAVINGNRELIDHFERRIKVAVGRVWDGDST